MTAPDLTTEVVGYRQWYVTDDLELRSAGYSLGGTWKRGDNTAKCGRIRPSPVMLGGANGWLSPYDTTHTPDPCGDCPGPECRCGFYALHDPSDHWYGKGGKMAIGLFTMMRPETDPLVSGIVVAWGKLQVHHEGFRAEHARIAAIALPESRRDQAVARAAARAYGVPCVPSEDLPLIAAEYGGTVPVEFRPKKQRPTMGQLAARYYGTTANTSLWTPADEKEEAPESRIAKYGKQPSNRQGPPRPQRAPKKLGGGRS